jgi:hypothetical protein
MGTPIIKITEYVNWRGKSAIVSSPMSGLISEASTIVDLSNYYTKSELQTDGLASVNFANISHAYHNGLLGLQGGSGTENLDDITYVEYIEAGHSLGLDTYRKGVRYGQLVFDRALTDLAWSGIAGVDWENLKAAPIGLEYFHLDLAQYSRITSWTFPESIVEETTGIIHLAGDEEIPGISKYYGTDAAGIKGFFTMSAGGVNPVSNILEWDAVNNWYAPYSTPNAGSFDDSTSYPSNITRLNYDGYFYTNQLFANAIVAGEETGTYSYLDSNLFWMYSSDTVRLALQPNVGDNGSVPYSFDTANAITLAGSKLVSVKNAGVEKFYISKDGAAYANGVLLAGDISLHLTGGGVTGASSFIISGSSAGLLTSLMVKTTNTNGAGRAAGLYTHNSADDFGIPNSSSCCYVANVGDSGYPDNYGVYIAGGTLPAIDNNVTGIYIDIDTYNGGAGICTAINVVHGGVKMTLPNAAGTHAVRYDSSTKLFSYN